MTHLRNLTRVSIVLAIACSPTGMLDQQGRRSTGTTPLPCQVAQLIQENCHECHGATPKFTAPMALVTWEDMQRPALSDPAKKVFQLIDVRIEDPADIMPPPPGLLEQGERDYLHGWIRAGAPRGDGCGVAGQGGAGGVGGGVGGSGAAPTTGGTGAGGSGNGSGSGGSYTGGAGGAGGGIIEPGSCEPMQLLAHGGQTPGDTTPFPVPVGMQDYKCFYFKSPWAVPTHALRFTPVIDNDQVLHHWLLYSSNTAYQDGTSASCFGVHSDGTLLAGWAPGSGEWVMPPEAGMELPSGNTNFVLEIHYYNSNLPSMVDRSGVEICATQNLRPNTATVSWLGTEGIALAPNAQGTATGTCAPTFQGPINIIRSWPHMHKLGRGMKADILRAGGGTESLFDVQNYSFDYQISYPTPAVINPGDRIVTTCTFQNTTPGVVFFGPRTEDEMCYNFVIAYPANALSSAGLMARSCML